MKDVTQWMINSYGLDEKGYDFMGYFFNNTKELTYHHIQPKNLGGKTTFDNGALLIRSSHNYIHTIEDIDFKLFIELSQELKREHIDGITKERLLLSPVLTMKVKNVMVVELLGIVSDRMKLPW